MTNEHYKMITEEARRRISDYNKKGAATQEYGIRENYDYWVAQVAWEFAQRKSEQ